MLAAGKFNAKVVDAGLSTNRDGNPQPFITFEVSVDGATDKITWYGSLKSEKSTEFAIKQIVVAGFWGNDWEDLRKPIEVVFKPKDLSIDVERNENGHYQVKWINEKKLKVFAGQVPKQANLFAKVKSEHGVTTSPAVDTIEAF